MARELGPREAARFAEAYERFRMKSHSARGYEDTPASNAMDRYNNAVGVNSVLTGSPYNLDNLQVSPFSPPAQPDLGLGTYDPATTRRRR